MIILKNALVFTLNPKDDFGRYSILINEDRISEIVKSDYSGGDEDSQAKTRKWQEMYPQAELMDCSDKMIMPGFVNACEKSEGILIKYLMRSRHYENTETDLCTDFIFNYIYQELQTEEMKEDLINIYNHSFLKNLKSGICYLNEFTLRKDTNHLLPVQLALKHSGQKISICYPIRQDRALQEEDPGFAVSYYLTDESQMTIYDISMINDLRKNGVKKLFLEVSTNKDVSEKFRRVFNKPVIKLFDEYNLIDENTSVINPLYLTYDEIRILSEKKANIIICPRDIVQFSNRYFPLDEFMAQNINFSVATGWLGDDMFKEMRLMRNKYKELSIDSCDYLRSVTQVPKALYFSEPGETDPYCIAPRKPADLVFVDLSDLRFQLFPENTDFNHMCDFIVDNLSSGNISDVMINGEFKVRAHRLVFSDEDDVIKASIETRKRLYSAGKYEELSKKSENRKKAESLEPENEDEIRLFSENPEEIPDDMVFEGRPDFKIKGRIPSLRKKTPSAQKNLFDEDESNNIIQSEENVETPVINLLFTEIEQDKGEDDEITFSKLADANILKYTPKEKKEASKNPPPESKIELPKNVKLKFGDE